MIINTYHYYYATHKRSCKKMLPVDIPQTDIVSVENENIENNQEQNDVVLQLSLWRETI